MLFKREIGKALLTFCDFVPQTKPFLRKFGLRTRKEWFGKRFADRVLGRDGEERRCMAPARHLGKRSRDVGSAARPVSEGAEKTPAHRGRASGPQ